MFTLCLALPKGIKPLQSNAERSQRGETDQIAIGQTDDVMDNPNSEKPKLL